MAWAPVEYTLEVDVRPFLQWKRPQRPGREPIEVVLELGCSLAGRVIDMPSVSATASSGRIQGTVPPLPESQLLKLMSEVVMGGSLASKSAKISANLGIMKTKADVITTNMKMTTVMR